jgi:hypothetical protein
MNFLSPRLLRLRGAGAGEGYADTEPARHAFGAHFAEMRADADHDLARYHVPVNADIERIEAAWIEDQWSPVVLTSCEQVLSVERSLGYE